MTTQQLKIFAYHIGSIHRMKADGDEATYSCAPDFKVHIRRTSSMGYYVNTVWVGNAEGAAAEYARLVGEHIEKLQAELPDARAYMKTISEVAGDEPGSRLTTRSSPADAERRGMMICEMRSIANHYLRRTEPAVDQPTSEISTNS